MISPGLNCRPHRLATDQLLPRSDDAGGDDGPRGKPIFFAVRSIGPSAALVALMAAVLPEEMPRRIAPSTLLPISAVVLAAALDFSVRPEQPAVVASAAASGSERKARENRSVTAAFLQVVIYRIISTESKLHVTVLPGFFRPQLAI